MFSLRLTCSPEQVDTISSDLSEFGTAGIQELDYDSRVVLIAGFEDFRSAVGIASTFCRI